MKDVTHRRTFVLEDTKNRDYRYIRAGLLRRGWQQVAFPLRQASEEGDSQNKGSKFDACWVQRRGAMGVASVGLKVVPCPDLIWTLSHGRLPGSRGLGHAQVTNFFDRSSCLTTKAGLCRTLQSSRFWGLENGEDFGSPSSFFPRCFDLSDLAQVDELKDDFRQTAAEAVLKVFHRFLGSNTRPVPSTTSATQSARKNDSPTSSPHPILAEHGGSDVGGWLDKVHSWILALALRACRRRLLEIAGWRDDQVGAWCTSSGAEHLKPQEWDSILIYSYILRRAVQPSLSKTVIPTSPGTDRPPQPHGRPTCVAESDSRALSENSDKPEDYASNRENCFSLNRGRSSEDSRRDRLHPTGVGLRGLQGLRFVPPTDTTNQTGRARFSRRPSSAPVRWQHENVVSEARYLSRGRGLTTATEATFTAGTGDNGRGIRHTAPGVWGVEECKELRNELFKIWSPPGFERPEGCGCPWDAYEGGEAPDCCEYLGGEEKKGGGEAGLGPVWRLMAETAQLCVALEKKCPQWKMDGESNLWILKPAGASRGQGVRLAWTMDQILYAQKTMGGRVVQKYIESPLLLRRRQPQPRPPPEAVPTGAVPTKSVPLEPVPTELAPTESIQTEPVPTEMVPTEPLSSHPDPRRHPYRRRGRLDGSPASASRRRVPQSRGENNSENIEADIVGAVNRTVPDSLHSETKQEPRPSGGAAAPPLSLPLRGLNEHDLDCFGGKEQRGINVGPPPPEATKFDLRVWVLVTGWKPLESFWFDECYLRVCPQKFTLDEANFGNPDVHLTNLCARRPVDRAFKTSAPSHGYERRRERRRPFSASHSNGRCSTNSQSSPDGRPRVGMTADNSAKASPWKHQEDEAGALRGELRVAEGGSEGFVASQADLIDALGGIGAGGEEWPPDTTGGLKKDQRRARGERLWKSKVYPSIQRVIKSTLLAAHSHVRPRTSSFQLFGFDVLLDQDFTPWLLEVNMSPALSHSSKRQSRMIQSMCEGLLRLTVDRIFPPPSPQPSSANFHDETTSFNGPETVTDDNEQGGKHVSAGNLSHQPGRWRPLTTPRSPFRKKGHKRAALSSASTPVAQALDSRVTPPVKACPADPSSQIFTVRGWHLSRRDLVRVERGVRGATAVQVLEDWWKSKVEGCRRLRSRKSCAAAVLSRWVIRLVTRRRQRAIRASNERSARVRQGQWRQLSVRILEHRRLAALSEACVLVQTTWRARRLERLRRSKLLRLKISVGLGGWARELHSRRRKKAAEIALGVVLAAKKRHMNRKRQAAEIVARALKTACNRRRKSPLPPQRNPCNLCQLSVVPAAQNLQRVDYVECRAATIIQRARRNAVARWAANNIRIVLARTLQEWFRTVLRNWERRRNSVAVVQRAWRQARQRRTHAGLRNDLHATDSGLHDVFGSAVVEEPQSIIAAAAKARDTNLAPWGATSGVKAGDTFQEGDAHHVVNRRETDGDSVVFGDEGDSSSDSISCSSCQTASTKEGYDCLEIIGFERENLRADEPPISGDEVLSQATTAHEDWKVPALNPAEGGVGSDYSGKDSGEESEPGEEGRTKVPSTVTAVLSPPNTPNRNTNSQHTKNLCHAEEARMAQNSSYSRGKQAVGQTERAVVETRDQYSGILSLDWMLCDIIDTKRPKRVSGRAKKRHGQPEVQCPRQASSGSPTATSGNKSRELDANKVPPYSVVVRQSIDSSRAPGGRVKSAVAQAQPNVATGCASRSRQRPHNRCQGTNFVDSAPLPRSTITPINSALGMGLESGRGRDAPAGKTCGGNRTRALPGGGKRAKGKPKTGKGVSHPAGSNSTRRSRKRVPRLGDSTRHGVTCGISSTCYNGESGAVLQMLASLEG